MKKFGIVIAVLLMFAMTVAVTRAQEDLTQTFNSSDGSYTFMYPAGWDLSDSGGAVVGGVDAGQPTQKTVFFVYQAFTGSIEDAPGQLLGDLTPIGYKDYPKKELQINGRNAAQYTTTIQGVAVDLIAIDFGDGKALVIMAFTTADQMPSLDATVQAILTTFHVNEGVVVVTPTQVPLAVADPTNSRSRIALSVRNGTGQALLLTDLSGQTTKIVNRGGYISKVKWSHDGTKLAFLSQPGADINVGNLVFVTDAAGNHVQAITEQPSTIDAVAWSPDDTQLIFLVPYTLTGGMEAGIYKVNVDGSGLTQLPLDIGDNQLGRDVLDWSPDGKQILFSASPKDTPPPRLYFADADGSHASLAEWNQGSAGYTLWSPDGQQLLTGSGDLTVENLDGSNRVVIVDYKEKWSISSMAWSPDGSQIVVEASTPTDDVERLYVVNSDGTNRRRLDFAGETGLGGVSWASASTAPAEATAAPTAAPQTDTTLFTATNGKYSVSAQMPAGADVSDASEPQDARIKMTGLSTVGFDATITFPLHVEGNTDPFAILASRSESSKQRITDIRIDDHKAARLDVPSDSDSSQQNVTYLVMTDAGDLVEIAFTIPADQVDALESAMMALVKSVTTATSAASDAAATPSESGSAAASACTVTANATANLRSGPGTGFAKAGSLAAGVSQSVTGQATGSDGKVWYQLDSGSYVRSDLVRADGDCASVPTVSP